MGAWPGFAVIFVVGILVPTLDAMLQVLQGFNG